MVAYDKDWDIAFTGIIGNKRISKGSKIISIIGFLDELNSYIGIIIADSKDKSLNRLLLNFQKDLFEVSGIIAGAKFIFNRIRSENLEKIIDNAEKKLPYIKNFILPGGSKISARLMYARALARKAEREFVGLSNKIKVKNRKEILRYLDRLSDTLYILARKNNYKENVKENFREIIWKLQK